MKDKYITLIGVLGLDLIFLGALLSWILSQFVLLSKIALGLGLILIILWLVFSWSKARQAIGKRSTAQGTSTILAVVFLVGIIVVANAFGAKFHSWIDLTKEKLYSLSDQTEKLLKQLDRKVELIVFDSNDSPKNPRAIELAQEYSAASPKISYTVINPDRRPALAKYYGVTQYGQMVVNVGKKKFALITNPNEQAITNSLKQLLFQGEQKAYFLTGHGETSPFDSTANGMSELAKEISQEGFTVDTLNLMRTGRIPDDAAIIVVAAPKVDLLPAERESLWAFYDRGGKLLFMLEPGFADSTAIWLGKFGVNVGNDLVIDIPRLAGVGPEMPLVLDYDANHPITKGFNLGVMFPTVRSVAAGSTKAGIRITELAKTSPQSWGETRWKTGRAKKDKNDLEGPVPVACAVQNVIKQPQPRMVVFGDHDFAVNQFLRFSGNLDLVMNSVDWLAKQENLIAIRPKNPEDRKLLLSPRQQQKIFYLSVVALPFVAILLAELFWWKKQYA